MPHVKQIFELLTKMQEYLLDMFSLINQEREDISKLNLKELDERRPRIESLNKLIRTVSLQITTLISAACAESGANGEQNLSVLITIIPEQERDMFVILQQSIRKISTDIDNALKVNRGLLEDSLAFANQSLALFTGMLKNSSTYGQAGRFVETVDNSRIINREI